MDHLRFSILTFITVIANGDHVFLKMRCNPQIALCLANAKLEVHHVWIIYHQPKNMTQSSDLDTRIEDYLNINLLNTQTYPLVVQHRHSSWKYGPFLVDLPGKDGGIVHSYSKNNQRVSSSTARKFATKNDHEFSRCPVPEDLLNPSQRIAENQDHLHSTLSNGQIGQGKGHDHRILQPHEPLESSRQLALGRDQTPPDVRRFFWLDVRWIEIICVNRLEFR